MAVQLSTLTMIMILVAIYLLWMDVALYINLQQLKPLYQRPPDADLENKPFSPFQPLTIKLLMHCPPLQYIGLPLAVWFEDTVHVSHYMTPNTVSFIGLGLGLIAARFFMCESYKLRLFGIVLYKLRDFMDGLDGTVARALKHEKKLTLSPGTAGYTVDAVCDGIADIAIIVATGIYLLRSISTSNSNANYKPLKDLEANKDKDLAASAPTSIWKRLSNLKMQWFMPVVINVTVFACVFGISSGLWNYFMYHYSILFDSNAIAITEHQQDVQNAVIKSPIMWLVIYMWRMINAVSMIQFFVVSVLYNKSYEFLAFMKQHGIIIILTATFISFAHYQYALVNISYQDPTI